MPPARIDSRHPAGASGRRHGRTSAGTPGRVGAGLARRYRRDASPSAHVHHVDHGPHDLNNVETITISGLKIKAIRRPRPGAIVATLVDNVTGNASFTARSDRWHRERRLATGVGIGPPRSPSTSTTGSPCNFTARRSPSRDVAVGSRDIAPATVASPAARRPIPAIAVSSTAHHDGGGSRRAPRRRVVTQTTATARRRRRSRSPATVVATARVRRLRHHADRLPRREQRRRPHRRSAGPSRTAGFLAKGSTHHLHHRHGWRRLLDRRPQVYGHRRRGTIGRRPQRAVLSADRKSIVVTVTTASSAATSRDHALATSCMTLPRPCPVGTFVEVNVTTSGGLS